MEDRGQSLGDCAEPARRNEISGEWLAASQRRIPCGGVEYLPNHDWTIVVARIRGIYNLILCIEVGDLAAVKPVGEQLAEVAGQHFGRGHIGAKRSLLQILLDVSFVVAEDEGVFLPDWAAGAEAIVIQAIRSSLVRLFTGRVARCALREKNSTPRCLRRKFRCGESRRRCRGIDWFRT